MAQSYEEFFRAAEAWNKGWENRSTETLATVVDIHHGLATKLVERFDLSAGEPDPTGPDGQILRPAC